MNKPETDDPKSKSWTHNMCGACWDRQHQGNRQPHRVTHSLTEICCYCGAVTNEGIFVRNDPNDPTLHCGGLH